MPLENGERTVICPMSKMEEVVPVMAFVFKQIGLNRLNRVLWNFYRTCLVRQESFELDDGMIGLSIGRNGTGGNVPTAF